MATEEGPELELVRAVDRYLQNKDINPTDVGPIKVRYQPVAGHRKYDHELVINFTVKSHDEPERQTAMPSTLTTARSNLVATFEFGLNQLLDLNRAHRLVHPDPDQCGGVGGCLMMRTEVEQEQELQRLITSMASQKISLRVTETK